MGHGCCCKGHGTHETTLENKHCCKSSVQTPSSAGQLIMLPIKEITQEAKNIKTLYFSHALHSKPGQFLMMWVPGVGEKPISIAGENEEGFLVTISAVGHFSEAITHLKKGSMVGIKGPLGTFFALNQKRIALVAGGYGAGPMAFLAECAIKEGWNKEHIHYIGGARTKDLLLFEKRMKTLGVQVHFTTNDGSQGTKGLVTDVLQELVVQKKVEMVYCCGPELMEKAVFDVAMHYHLGCQISLERYMKCGIGVCGSCVVDPLGLRMCVEGPVIDKETAEKITEFGVYHRDPTGKKIYFGSK
ncbi:dihydroorotate dehydrogenase electron transfer subunit [Candidatus Woesearchaeota archaeon]|nr:dihydroorotate dehydrogenase electron transfer subunit [Candidatus Woesearchaeota archaeon]